MNTLTGGGVANSRIALFHRCIAAIDRMNNRTNTYTFIVHHACLFRAQIEIVFAPSTNVCWLSDALCFSFSIQNTDVVVAIWR